MDEEAWYPNQENVERVRLTIRDLRLQRGSSTTAALQLHYHQEIERLERWLRIAQFSPCVKPLAEVIPKGLVEEDSNNSYCFYKSVIVDGFPKKRRWFRLGSQEVFVKSSRFQSNTVLGDIATYQVGTFQIDQSTRRFIPSQPERFVAVKTYKSELFDANKEDMVSELKIQRRLNESQDNLNPYVLSLLDFVACPGKYMAIFPFMDNGSLESYISEVRFDSEQAEKTVLLFIMKSMLNAVRHIHLLGISHRDISLCNFLMQDDGESVLLSDFGLARRMDDDWMIRCSKGCAFVGKYRYAAPELYHSETESFDGRKIDVWSLGVCFFRLFTRKDFPWLRGNRGRPYTMENLRNLFQYLSHDGPPSTLPSYVLDDETLRDVLESTLRYEPESRPCLEQLCNHPFVTGNYESDGSQTGISETSE